MKTMAFNMMTNTTTDSLKSSFSSSIKPTTTAAAELAKEIMMHVMKYRRTVCSHNECATSCPACLAPHLEKVTSAIEKSEPITFVLPAFPGKSPNLAKVLSPLPDMAEQRSLQFLNRLCNQLQKIYTPGAEIILCSDGRVFSDAVGMREEDVTSYQDALDKMIEDLSLHNLSTFNLDELAAGRDFDQMRQELMQKYGQPLDTLREKVRAGGKACSTPENKEANRMYCGITRFLVEDSTFPGQTKSRTAVQKDCRARAYDVILRSNAWSELIAELFPNAVRLSIHPQACGAKKLGIRLIGSESWMTPWHGVAVDTEEGFVLLKRSEAESKGAQLVYTADGRPSHYELNVNLTKTAHLQLPKKENQQQDLSIQASL